MSDEVQSVWQTNTMSKRLHARGKPDLELGHVRSKGDSPKECKTTPMVWLKTRDVISVVIEMRDTRKVATKHLSHLYGMLNQRECQ